MTNNIESAINDLLTLINDLRARLDAVTALHQRTDVAALANEATAIVDTRTIGFDVGPEYYQGYESGFAAGARHILATVRAAMRETQ